VTFRELGERLTMWWRSPTTGPAAPSAVGTTYHNSWYTRRPRAASGCHGLPPPSPGPTPTSAS